MRSKATTIQHTTQTGTKSVSPAKPAATAKAESKAKPAAVKATTVSSAPPDIASPPARKTRKVDAPPVVSQPDVPSSAKSRAAKAETAVPPEPVPAKGRSKHAASAPIAPPVEEPAERMRAAIRWYEQEPAEKKTVKSGTTRKADPRPPAEALPVGTKPDPQPEIREAAPKQKQAAAEPKHAAAPRKTRMSLNRAIAARASEKIAESRPAAKPPAVPKATATLKSVTQSEKTAVEARVRSVASTPAATASRPPTPATAAPRPTTISPPAIGRRRVSSTAEAGGRKRTPVVQGDRAVVQPMVVLDNGRIWKMAGNSAVAYVRTAANACAILKSEPGQLAKRAMAVYRDRNGKAIAWQVRFEAARWAEVEGMLK